MSWALISEQESLIKITRLGHGGSERGVARLAGGTILDDMTTENNAYHVLVTPAVIWPTRPGLLPLLILAITKILTGILSSHLSLSAVWISLHPYARPPVLPIYLKTFLMEQELGTIGLEQLSSTSAEKRYQNQDVYFWKTYLDTFAIAGMPQVYRQILAAGRKVLCMRKLQESLLSYIL